MEHLPKEKHSEVPIDMLTLTGTLMELIQWWIKTGEIYTPK
jgi:hypothetical protein